MNTTQLPTTTIIDFAEARREGTFGKQREREREREAEKGGESKR